MRTHNSANFSIISRAFAFFIGAALLSGFFIPLSASAAVTVTPASGGTAISADTTSAVGGSNTSTTLGSIIIDENSNGDFNFTPSEPRTFILNAPTGFTFDTSSSPNVTFNGGEDISSVSVTSFTATALTITITPAGGNVTNDSDDITIGSVIPLKVKPTTSVAGTTGNITNSGTLVIIGVTQGTTNFGTLTEVAGAVSASQSTLTAVPTPITADGGSSAITITAKDQFGNPISGIAAANVVLSVNPVSGSTLTQPTSATNASGVTTGLLHSTSAGSKTISVTINGTLITQTAVVTVNAGAPATGAIVATPNATVEANLAGTTVTLTITVTDGHGNLVTDNTTVSLVSDLGTVGGSGNTVNGIVTRTLSYNNKGVAHLTFSGLTATGNTTITFADTTKPIITVIPPDPATVEYRGVYTDNSATATDNIDGDRTASIITVNPVDPNVINVVPNTTTKVVGVYTVTYNVSDTSGNTADEKTRTVNVLDTTAPVISAPITSNATVAGTRKVNDTITFTLTPDIAEPVATIAGAYNGQTLTWTTADIGATYTATYTATEGDADHAFALQISGVIMTDEAGNASTATSGSDVVKTIDANTPAAPSAPTASVGPYINAAEELAGFATVATYSTTLPNGAKADDTLELWLDGAPFTTPKTIVLSASDITAGSYSFSVSSGELGLDGAKSLTARLTDVAGNVGLWSAPLVGLKKQTGCY